MSEGHSWWDLSHRCRDADGNWQDGPLAWVETDMPWHWLECSACHRRAAIEFPPNEQDRLAADSCAVHNGKHVSVESRPCCRPSDLCGDILWDGSFCHRCLVCDYHEHLS